MSNNIPLIRQTKHAIYIDSSQRKSGSINKFTIDILPTIYNVIAVEVTNLDFNGNIFYNVNSTNNTFKWIDTDDEPHTTTIEPQIFKVDELATEIAIEMNKEMDANGFCYDTPFDQGRTDKIDIKSDIKPEDDFTFTLVTTDPASKKFYKMIGFDTTFDHVGQKGYTAENIMNIKSPRYAYIKSQKLTNVISDETRLTNSFSDVVHKFQLGTTNFKGASIKFNGNNQHLSQVDIEVETDDGFPLEFNGIDWGFTLLIFTGRKFKSHMENITILDEEEFPRQYKPRKRGRNFMKWVS